MNLYNEDKWKLIEFQRAKKRHEENSCEWGERNQYGFLQEACDCILHNPKKCTDFHESDCFLEEEK